jgi:MoxR-like ATPase
MEEHQVTVDGATYQLGTPFMVVATQNPIEMEGTYPLPEAQRDRFMARLSMGYPERTDEVEMLAAHGAGRPLEHVAPVASAAEVAALIGEVRDLHVGEQVHHYAVDLVAASRVHPDLRLGASPRAALQLIRAAKAAAALDDRDYVIPDDVRSLAVPVLAHRLLLTAEAQIARRTSTAVVESIVGSTSIPAG